MANSNEERYHLRGVSADKTEVHQAIKNLDKGLYPKAFCKIVPDYLTHNPEYCVVMHADGAGTKSSFAYIYWRETGDLSVWEGIARDALVMNLDDLLCVGVTNNILLSSTIGRNKNRIPAEVIQAIIEGTQRAIEELRQFGVNLYLTGGETADVGDLVRTVIVDSTVTARIAKKKVINTQNIAAGDVIVGLASDGQAVYEKKYNSGMGSNGLSSARHDLFWHELANLYPESFEPTLPDDLVYTGNYQPQQLIEETGLTVGQMVLSPTRTYAPVIKKILDTIPRSDIHGIIHNSGGAQTKILHFIDALHVVKNNLFPVPLLFRLIQKESKTQWREMYKVFNCGHRMELYVPPTRAKEIIEISRSFGIGAQIIGHVESSPVKKLTIKSAYGTFEYS